MRNLKYELILFDADDTLFDFKRSQRDAFVQAVAPLMPDHNMPDVFLRYRDISRGFWQQFEAGMISRDTLRSIRFQTLFEEFKVEANAHETSEHYLKLLLDFVHLVDHAQSMCETLKLKTKLGVITNGFSNVARERFKRSSLNDLIDFIVVPEDCGSRKPEPEMFEYALGKANHFDKATTLMIGDTLEADIEGGNLFGVDTCWFNPEQKENDTAIEPTYEISCLSQFIETIASRP